jgi:FtsP/CotA-like multicopper oxidase with cupredoxin domain
MHFVKRDVNYNTSDATLASSVQFSQDIHFFIISLSLTKPAHIGASSSPWSVLTFCLINRYRWHSHSLSQRADGLFGAFVIHDPIDSTQPQSDVGHSKEDLRIRDEHSLPSERLLLIGDWYHRNSTAMLSWYRSKRSYGYVRGMSETDLLADFWSQEPTPETALFNGVNAFDCSRASRFVECDASKGRNPYLFLDPHSKTRLRLVNTGYVYDKTPDQ